MSSPHPSRFLEGSVLPSTGEILRLLSHGEVDAATYDEERAGRYLRREGFDGSGAVGFTAP